MGPTKRDLPSIAGAALGVVLLGVFGYFLWFAFGAFARANPSVQASIITAIAAVSSLIATFVLERNRAFREAHREKKIEAYTPFFNIIKRMNNAARSGSLHDAEAELKLVEELIDIKYQALLYGSPKVIKSLSAMGTVANSVDDKLAAFRPMGRILLAMREDIGLSNQGLDEINIHQIYVSDDLSAMGKK